MWDRRYPWPAAISLARFGLVETAVSSRSKRHGAALDDADLMVLLCWLLDGERHVERVPLSLARHRHAQLESIGAVVYWSERLALVP